MIKNLVLIVATFSLCSLLLTDAFLIPGKEKSVSISTQSYKYTALRNARYYSYFIFTSDNCKYEVKINLYGILNIGDSVKIISSRILRMPIGLYYYRNNQVHFCKIGQLNTYKSEKIAIMTCLLISVPLLIFQYNKPLKSSGILFALQAISLATSILLFLTIMAEVILIYHSS